MLIPRTQPDPTRIEGKEEASVSFINEVTHWWDGSQIYGSDQETVDRLRSGVDGKLRVNPDGTLPLNRKGIEETGFVRNWWVGMSMLHTLFTREHNAICDHLKMHYPDWDDTRAAELIRQLDLPAGRQLRHLSRGMRMKASLASSLAYHPRLLVLDEPFSGLDPLVRDELAFGDKVFGMFESWLVQSHSHDLVFLCGDGNRCGPDAFSQRHTPS